MLASRGRAQLQSLRAMEYCLRMGPSPFGHEKADKVRHLHLHVPKSVQMLLRSKGGFFVSTFRAQSAGAT